MWNTSYTFSATKPEIYNGPVVVDGKDKNCICLVYGERIYCFVGDKVAVNVGAGVVVIDGNTNKINDFVGLEPDEHNFYPNGMFPEGLFPEGLFPDGLFPHGLGGPMGRMGRHGKESPMTLPPASKLREVPLPKIDNVMRALATHLWEIPKQPPLVPGELTGVFPSGVTTYYTVEGDMRRIIAVVKSKPDIVLGLIVIKGDKVEMSTGIVPGEYASQLAMVTEIFCTVVKEVHIVLKAKT